MRRGWAVNQRRTLLRGCASSRLSSSSPTPARPLRLHDTHEGRLLASAIGSGKSIDELDESAQKAAEELFAVR